MIWIYECGYEDFSTNGMGSLTPTRCKVPEEQNGAYVLEMDHPIDKDGKFALLKNERVLKVPVAAQTTPFIRMPEAEAYEVWETNAKAKVYTKQTATLGSTVVVTPDEPDFWTRTIVKLLGYTDGDGATQQTKWVSNGNRVLEAVDSGVEVSVLTKDGSWYRVTTPNGNTGWMQAASLTLVTEIASRPPETIQAHTIRDQLFRIYRTRKDTKDNVVRVWARHISYDQRRNALMDCTVANKTVTQCLATIDAACTQPDHGFHFYTDSDAVIEAADWSRKGYLEAILDPDEGLAALANLRVVRDNYDFFLLTRSETARQAIRYTNNLLGVDVDVNDDGIVNRIIPVGRKADGDPLYIDDEYVDSDRNNDATIIRAKTIAYDVQVSDTLSEADAKTALIAAAEEDFTNGIDLPEITVDVDFLQLGDTEEYQQYRDLDRRYMGDLIAVYDDAHGVELEAEITQTDFDVLTQRYTHMNVGVTEAARTIGSIESYSLGRVSGRKIAMASLPGSALEARSIRAAKIAAGAIVAELIAAGVITSDKLYAGVVEALKIQAENIAAGEINATHVGANEVIAQTANIKDLIVTNAKIAAAGLDYAVIRDLVAGTAIITDGIGGRLLIERLDVSEANIVNLTAGQLIIQGTDGNLYQLTVDGEGSVTTILRQIVNGDVADLSLNAGEKLIDGTITAAKLNVQQIFGAEAMIGAIKAVNIEAHSLGTDQINPAAVETIAGGARQVSIQFTNGAILDEDNTETVATMKMYLNGVDITDTISADIVRWERISDEDDTAWNAAHIGTKTVTLTSSDINFRGVLRLVIDETLIRSRPAFDGKYLVMEGDDAADFTADGKYLTYSGDGTYSVSGNVLQVELEVAGIQVDVQLSNLLTSYMSIRRSGIEIFAAGQLKLSGGAVQIDTQYFSVTKDDVERMVLDELGNLAIYAGSVSSSHFIGDIVNKYLGSSTIAIDASIQTVISNLPKYLTEDVTITIPAGTYNEDIDISGFMGARLILDCASGVIVNGNVTIQNDAAVSISGGKFVGTSATATIDALSVNDLVINGSIVVGKTRASAGESADYCIRAVSCNGQILNTDLQRADTGLLIESGCMYLESLTGGQTSGDYTTIALLEYGVEVLRGANAGYATSLPVGETANTLVTAAVLTGSGTPTQSPNAAPPAAPDYTEYASTAYRRMRKGEYRTGTSYLGEPISWGSWSVYTYDDWAESKPRQGIVTSSAFYLYGDPPNFYYRQNRSLYYGLWITPAIDDLASITEASLTITRDSAEGSTGAVTIYIYKHGLTTAPTGHDYSVLTSTGLSVSLNRGESKTIALDATTLAALKAGTVKGFGLYSGGGYAQLTSGLTVNVTY